MFLQKVFSYIIPQSIVQISSPYNTNIRLNLEFGRYKLLVNGSSQSGAYIEGLWNHAFNSFKVDSITKMRRVLVLGVGGGTVITMLRARFPKAEIVGVDIDEKIIEIGKKYFQLDTIDRLQLYCMDATKYLKSCPQHYFDMIVVDIFIGTDIPDFVVSEDFVRLLKTALLTEGIVLVNYLRERQYAKISQTLEHLLGAQFKTVKTDPIKFNRFFWAH